MGSVNKNLTKECDCMKRKNIQLAFVLFAVVGAITFYSSSFIFDMITQFIVLANIFLIFSFNQPCKEKQ